MSKLYNLYLSNINICIYYKYTKFEKYLQKWSQFRTTNKSKDTYRLFISFSEKLKIPPKALRTFYHEDIGEIYVKDEYYFFQCNGLKILFNQNAKEVYFTLQNENVDIPWYLYQTLTWIIAKASLKNNISFFQGHILSFCNQNILISGNPECGKFLFLRDLHKLGAKLISHNALINCKTTQIVKHNLGLYEPRKDLPSNSEIFSCPNFNIANNKSNSKISKIIIVNSWNSAESNMKEISKWQLIDFFTVLNQKFYNFFSIDQQCRLIQNYCSLFNKTENYFLFKGTNFEKLKKELIKIYE